jgi:two-component sensor histidine kinase
VGELALASKDPIDSLKLYDPPRALANIISQQQKQPLNRRFVLTSQALEILYQMGRYQEADSTAAYALDLRKWVSDTLTLMNFYRNYARLSSIRLKGELAVAYFDTAMTYYRTHNLVDKWCLTKINLADHYRHYQNYEACERHLNEVLAIPAAQLSQATLANAYHRMAALYAEYYEAKEKAEALSLKSLTYSKAVNHVQHMATSYNELGNLYIEKDIAKAQMYFNKALKIWEAQGALRDKANLLAHLARHYLYAGEYEKANTYIDKALPIPNLQNMPLVHYRILNLKAAIAFGLGSYKEAYTYRDQGALLYEDVLYKQYNTRLTAWSQRYETDLALSKLQAAEKEKALAQETTENERAQKLRSFYGLIFTTILAVVLLFFYRNNRRSKRQIEKQNSIITEQNTALNESLQQKDVLLQEVHHRVKNNFQYTLALLEMQLTRTAHIEAKHSLNAAIRRMLSMALVHEKLYTQNEAGKIYVDEYLSELISIIEDTTTQGDSITITRDIAHQQLDFQRCISLGMILSELVANSFKYAFAGVTDPGIHIAFTIKEKGYCFEYRDNGVGLQETQGTGLGMRIIDMFSRQIGGSYTLEGNEGVHFTMTFKAMDQ